MTNKTSLRVVASVAIVGLLVSVSGLLGLNRRQIDTIPLANGLHFAIDQPQILSDMGERSFRLEVSGLATTLPEILRRNPAWEAVMIETRLDMSAIQVIPPGVVSQSAIDKDKLVFHWRLLPREGGGTGTLWVWLRGVGGGTQMAEKQVLLSRPISVEGDKQREIQAFAKLIGGLVLIGLAAWVQLRRACQGDRQ